MFAFDIPKPKIQDVSSPEYVDPTSTEEFKMRGKVFYKKPDLVKTFTENLGVSVKAVFSTHGISKGWTGNGRVPCLDVSHADVAVFLNTGLVFVIKSTDRCSIESYGVKSNAAPDS